jgi:hypothetical protein
MRRSARRLALRVATFSCVVTLFATCEPLTETTGIPPSVNIEFSGDLSLADADRDTLVAGREFTAQVIVKNNGAAIDNARWSITSSDTNVIKVTGIGPTTRVRVLARGKARLTARLIETSTSARDT